MEIIWHGQACLTIKGADATLITVPYGEGIGINLPKLKADIVTLSLNDSNSFNSKAVEGEPKILSWPGEYEVRGVLLNVLSTPEGSTTGESLIFKFEMDGFRFCHLGNIRSKLPEAIIENLGDIDILFVPVGGGEVLDFKAAHEVVEQIDPRIIIPIYYQIEGLITPLNDLELFLKEMGTHPEPQESFKIKSRVDLPAETTELIVLMPKLG